MPGRLRLPPIATLQAQTERYIQKYGNRGAMIVLDDEQYEELRACSESFVHFCERWVYVQDKVTKRDELFNLFEGQRRVVPEMVAGRWLCLLKGRQLGLTWLCAAFVLWCLLFRTSFTCVVINQEKQYAQDFIWRVKFMYDRLPVWMRKQITKKDSTRLKMEAGGNQGDLRAVVGGEKGARSVTADLVIVDEASRVDDLEATLAAIQPTVGDSGGQIVLLSSSAGPQGVFYECWKDSYGLDGEKRGADGVGENRYMPIFLHWSERRGRDQAWYDREAQALNKISPVRMKQEHPENPQEAWEYASGRVYPLFTRARCVGTMEIPTTAELYRAIDWGQTDSPFVCLWIAHIKGPTGLLVSPECPELIREMLSYRYNDDRPDEPLKEDDHGPDALRYAVTTFRTAMTGLVYVYREFYLRDSVEKGWNPIDEIDKVHEMSGWQPSPPDHRTKYERGPTGEVYVNSVADRSWPSIIKLFCAHDLPLVPHKAMHKKKRPKEGVLTENPLKERLEGIRRLSVFVDGSRDLDKVIPITREEQALQLMRREQARKAVGAVPATTGLDERSRLHLAKRLIQARRRGKKRTARR